MVASTTARSFPPGWIYPAFLLAKPTILGKIVRKSIGIDGNGKGKVEEAHALTRVLVGVDIAEAGGLLGELQLAGAVPKLLHQECIVPLRDLPDKVPRNGSHSSSPRGPRSPKKCADLQIPTFSAGYRARLPRRSPNENPNILLAEWREGAERLLF